MSKVPFKLLVRKLETKDLKPGEETPMKLVLLTDTEFLKELIKEAEATGYAGHQISMPGSASGLDEIIFEMTPANGLKRNTHYMQDAMRHGDKLVHICTLNPAHRDEQTPTQPDNEESTS